MKRLLQLTAALMLLLCWSGVYGQGGKSPGGESKSLTEMTPGERSELARSNPATTTASGNSGVNTAAGASARNAPTALTQAEKDAYMKQFEADRVAKEKVAKEASQKTQAQNSSLIELTEEEYKNVCPEKKALIDSNPDKYIIKKN